MTEEPTTSAAAVLVAREVSKVFTRDGGDVEVLRNLSFSIRAGEIVAIVGPSGCGKTTLLRILAQLLTPSSGCISTLPPTIARTKPTSSFVFQKPLLLPWRTVAENILLPLELLGKLDEAGAARCREIVAAVGLLNFDSAYPSQLSGGMAQRASLARALITMPDILFLDEPLSAVDEITRERLWVDFHRLWRVRGLSALLVTHSIREAAFLADRVLVMTAQPGTILSEISISLAVERSAETLYQPKFAKICESIREALISGCQSHENR